MSNYQFDRTKWQGLTIFDQMGNIGAEYGRVRTAKKRQDKTATSAALYRGLDLLDATIEGLVKQGSPRFKEVLIVRDQFCQSALGEADDQKLDDYFMQFALAARRGHTG